MSEARFLGIDFSGAAAPWRPRCSRPTVWIASLEGFRLADLRPVQDLDGNGDPFERLTSLLREGRYRAAAIDAPLSLPHAHMPTGGHAQLLMDIGKLSPAADRPFPRGAAIVRYAASIAPLASAKPSRQTERLSGAHARSTLWNGRARPGAPFTAAALTLASRARRPVWPWKDAPGMLVEAFPAAQLKAWGLPHTNYTAPEERALRQTIVSHLERTRHVDIEPTYRREMLKSPDALDAVIAAFAGRAAANRQLHVEKPPAWKTEGAIAIHKA